MQLVEFNLNTERWRILGPEIPVPCSTQPPHVMPAPSVVSDTKVQVAGFWERG